MITVVTSNSFEYRANNEPGQIIDPNVIYANLKELKEAASFRKSQPSIAPLCTLERNRWAQFREELCDAGNDELLRAVDSAIFVLALDDHVGSPNALQESIRQFLAGDANNRWVDKSFSLIMDGNGKAAVNFEHSWGDGVVLLRLLSEICRDCQQRPALHHSALAAAPPVAKQLLFRPLEFHLTDGLKQAIQTAQSEYKELVDSLEVSYLLYPRMHVNKNKDFMMQAAFQLAYQKQFGKVANAYETASTAGFRHGRSETLRSLTPEMVALVQFLLNSSANGAPLSEDAKTRARALFDEAKKWHSQLVREAVIGQGWDRHLLALKHLAESRFPPPLPALFRDEAYRRINQHTLSTSTLSDPLLESVAFAPVVFHGYGLGYTVNEQRAGCVVTAFPSRSATPDTGGKRTSASGYVQLVSQSLDLLFAALEPNKQ